MNSKNDLSDAPDPRIGFFDALAPAWDREEPSQDETVARLDACRELMDLRPGTDLLEVGCGTGKTTAWLAAQVAPGRVTGVDFAPRMIEAARAKGIDADFRCLDVCGGPLALGPFDAVFCFHCFPHFRDQAAAVRNLSAVLRPAGRLIVMHLAGSEQINRFHAGLSSCVCRDLLPLPGQWASLLAAGGLVPLRQIDREDLFFLDASRPGPA